ncbi:MAG: hypothetical protein ACPL8I_00915 [Chloroflexaceae bacterium]
MRFVLYVMLLCILVLAHTGCGGGQQGAGPRTEVPPSVAPTAPTGAEQITGVPTGDATKGGPAACPRLDPILYALTTASDPAAFAAASNIRYEQGRALVFVTFTAPVDFDQYGATVTAQTDQLAQALVPPNELCRLANDANVAAVRPPDMAAPTRS